jgi:8-oxo-dGTP pyrophosphatase MutT (NUDIX family)
MLQRTDNDLWTIPTGGLKTGETIRECGVRECHEETGGEDSEEGLHRGAAAVEHWRRAVLKTPRTPWPSRPVVPRSGATDRYVRLRLESVALARSTRQNGP